MTRYMVVAEVTFVSGSCVTMPCELHETQEKAETASKERQAQAAMFAQHGKIYLPTGRTGGQRLAASVDAFLGGALGIRNIRYLVAAIDEVSPIVAPEKPSLILPAS